MKWFDRMKSILFISPNTNVEYTWRVPGFRAGEVFRAAEELILASGKGINAARAARTLGVGGLCMGFTAGVNGQYFTSLLENEGLPGHFTRLEDGRESRIAVSIFDPLVQGQGANATVINGLGPQVNAQDWERFSADIYAELEGVGLAAVAGSLPPGPALDDLAGLIRGIQKRNVPVWYDGAGAALQAALAAKPAGIKVNALEAQNASGVAVKDVRSACKAAGALHEAGAQNVIITLGGQGAVWFDGRLYWQALSNGVEIAQSAVGSGDAFLGGLLAGLAQGASQGDVLRMASAAGAANTLSTGGGRFRLEDYRRLLNEVKVRPLKN
jgi:1-phosphofructokinase family hexose kinase